MKVVTFQLPFPLHICVFLGAGSIILKKESWELIMLSRELVWSAVSNISQALIENQ